MPIDLVDSNATAAGVMGSGDEFAPYLHAHRHGAYYEVASATVYAVTTLIVHDAQPVLVLNDFHGPDSSPSASSSSSSAGGPSATSSSAAPAAADPTAR